MKKSLKCIIFIAAAIILLSTPVSVSAESSPEYLVTQSGDTYTLNIYRNGIPEPVSSAGSINSLLPLCNGGDITFDNIIVSEPVDICGLSIVLRGALICEYPLTVLEGSYVTAEDILIQTDSYIRVKGGSLFINGGEIVSSETAITVDYSSSSTLSLRSAKITTSGAYPALSLKNGSTEIRNSQISSKGSCTIESSASLLLGGNSQITSAKYGISAAFPISLARTSGAFSAELSVIWNGEFEDGGMYEIFRDAEENSLDGIMLFDSLGKEYPVKYFEESEHTDERFYGAVYLPFQLTYYDGGTKIGSVDVLYGDLPKLIAVPQKSGYTFSGWYADAELTEDFSSSDRIYSDCKIYAQYKLNAPNFSLSSMTFTYDGTQRLFGFDTLTHELEGGFYSLEWYKDGEYVGNLEKIAVRSVKDSGEYHCIITYHIAKDSITIETPKVSISVLKSVIKLPAATAKVYNGKLQYSDIISGLLYSANDNGGINAGEYKVLLTLNDSENFKFEGVEGSEAEVIFKISKAENKWTSIPKIKDFYQNTPAEHSAHAAFGVVKFIYSDKIDGAYTEAVPTAPGKYYCIARVEETENYYEIFSAPKAFSILPEIPIGISICTSPEKTVYKAFDRLLPFGLSVNITYNSGRIDNIGADALGIKYQSGDAFLYGDNAVTVSYMGLDISLPITVEKREYDISNITFQGQTLVYNGKYQTLKYEGTLPVGLDGIPLIATVGKGGMNAGEYTVGLTFSTESTNYILPENKTAILKITPLPIDVIWGDTVFVYDGTSKVPEAYYINENGVKIALFVSGAQINAREGIIAEAISPSANYILRGCMTEFEIRKADIPLDGIKWSASSFPYDNENRSVSVGGLPEGITVVGYTDNIARDAGVYTATAILSYDTQNYNPPPPITHIWTITRIDYPAGNYEFTDSEFVYDGNPHYPALTGNLPVGLDGIELGYSFSRGITDVTNGKASVTVSFFTDSKNYNCPEDITAYVTVTPMLINVTWSYTPVSYDGKPHIPSAYSAMTEIVVSGAMTDAGSYTAVAESISRNYTIINSEYDFEILKAENLWLTYPAIADIYASGAPAPKALSQGGIPSFKYYSDAECQNEVSEFTSGVYYMLCTVAESKNYLALCAEPVSFRVIAVIPEKLFLNMEQTVFTAFEFIKPSDITVTVSYNDGNTAQIPFSMLEIVYQSADSLRTQDTFFTVKYAGLTESVTVSVSKAVYDMSAVVWKNTVHIYNGENKIPSLMGLPNGVKVIEYIGYGKNTGTYSVTASLEYDSQNYQPPIVPPTTLVIEKCKLPMPYIPNEIYSGTAVLPKMDTTYYKTDFEGAINAGLYKIPVSIADPANYAFENGEQNAYCELLILPKEVAVRIPEQTLYLWQSPKMPDVELLSSLFESDVIDFGFVVVGDTLRVISRNPNYALSGNEVKINRISRPSPETSFIIVAITVAFILSGLVAVAIYINRDRISDAVEARRCKKAFMMEAEIRKIDELALPMNIEEPTVFSVNVERADTLITDSLAKNLIKRERETVYTEGKRKCVINIDTVSDNYVRGETVDINTLKEKGLIPTDAGNIKILARGSVDKPLTVKANAFSLSAVKMIALSGGEAIKVITQALKHEKR